MSDKSARGYARFQFFFSTILSRFSVICTQAQTDAERIRKVIVDDQRIEVCNTMKFDQSVDIGDGDAKDLLKAIRSEAPGPTFTAASTHPGEEETMVRVIKKIKKEFPRLLHILIPRHIERTAEIEKLLKNMSINYMLLTDLRVNVKLVDSKGSSQIDVLLVNTTGEMMNFMAVSDIVFVGKSLGENRGGHNIIEPAILGKPIIFGENMDNFRLVASIFKQNNACIQVRNEQELYEAIIELLKDEKKRENLGQLSRLTVDENKGAIEQTIRILESI